MTLLYADDAAYLVQDEPQRYALGDPADPLLVLNAADEFGVMWVCEEPDGWDAPSIDLPLDRRQGGHGAVPGEPTYEERTLSFTGSAEAPTPAAARAARTRLLRAFLDSVRSGEELLYTHLDEEPARSLYVLPSGQPRVAIDGRWLDYAFVLVAGDPIKRGADATYGPVRLLSTATEPGRLYTAGSRSYTAGGRTYGQSATLTETRRNLAVDPRAMSTNPGANALGWTNFRWYGTGGAGAVTLLAGQAGPAGTGLTTAIRKTWTTASTGIGNTGFQHGAGGNAALPVVPGTSYAVSSYLRPSAAGKSGRVNLYWYDAAGAALGAIIPGALVALTAAAWTRVSIVATAPAGAAYLLPASDVDAGTMWAAGDTLDGTGLLVEVAGAVGTYLDGETTDTASLLYGWTGTANASPSIEQSVAVTTGGGSLAATVAFVPNAGDESAPALFTITGPVPGPVIQLATGEFVELDLDVLADDRVEVDTDAGTIYVNGVNRFDALVDRSTFPQIPPGGTEVRLRSRIGGSHQSAGLTITTAPRWT